MRNVFMSFLLAAALLACKDQKAKEESPMVKTATTAEKKPAQAEFADLKYTTMGKQMMRQLEAGNIDQWVSNFADNGVYTWSSGDSLAGKKAITDYWRNRRLNVIDSIHFSNDIWIPIKVVEPQRGPDVPGIWLLSWNQVNVKYKNGKKLMFWVHTDYHYDANNKIDRAVQYIDRAPINAALGMQAPAGMKPAPTK